MHYIYIVQIKADTWNDLHSHTSLKSALKEVEENMKWDWKLRNKSYPYRIIRKER